MPGGSGVEVDQLELAEELRVGEQRDRGDPAVGHGEVEDHPQGSSHRPDRPGDPCSTKASRSAGASISRTTSMARPTESACTTSCWGRRVVVALGLLRHVHPDRLLAPARTRAEPVQADTRRRWSATRRGSRSAVVGPAQPQPDLLDSIVGLVERAEHAVGHRPQVGAVLLEAPGQVIAVLHGHLLRSGSLIPVTSRVAPM